MGRTQATKKLLEDRGAEWAEDADAEVVQHFGNPDEEYARLSKEGLGIIERGERQTLVMHGPDAVPWFQGLVTNDLHELVDEGSGHRNAVVNNTGRFISDLRVLHVPQLMVVDLEPGTLQKGLWSHLRGQIIREDLELEDRSEVSGRLGVYGRRAADALETLADWSHPLEQRPAFHGAWTRWQGHDVIAQRMVWSETPGFELICAVEVVPQLAEELESKGDEPVWFGRQTFETLRVESGVPRFGVELDDRVIPLEAGFDDAIAFEKGCYLGQEIIARLDTRGTPAKLLRRIIFDAQKPPEAGADLYPVDSEGGRAAGEIRSAVWSPRHETVVALGYVKRNHNDIGSRVVVDDMEGRLEPLLDIESS